eukprot:4850456-Karenia_brevis.AAC.1
MSYDIAVDILRSLLDKVPMSYDVGTDILQPQPEALTMSYDIGSDFWDPFTYLHRHLATAVPTFAQAH